MEAPSNERILFRRANCLPVVVFGLLAMTAAFSARRLAGAFESPLPIPMLLVTTAFFVLVVWTARLGSEKGIEPLTGESHPGKQIDSAIKRSNPIFTVLMQGKNKLSYWGLFVASLLAMFAFSWPMTRIIDWIVWLPILIVEVGLIGNPTRFMPATEKEYRTCSRGVRMLRAKIQIGAGLFSEDVPVKPGIDFENEDRIPLSLPPCQDRVLQKITRFRDAEGNESLYGTFCAEFMPNERTVVLHVAFCPPLVVTPEVHLEQSSGPDAWIRVTQVFTHGARIEVRLAQPAPISVSVTFDIAVTGSK